MISTLTSGTMFRANSGVSFPMRIAAVSVATRPFFFVLCVNYVFFHISIITVMLYLYEFDYSHLATCQKVVSSLIIRVYPPF